MSYGGGGGGWVVLGCRFYVEGLIFGFSVDGFGFFFFNSSLIWDLILLCFGLIFMIGISCVVMDCGDGSWAVVSDLQKCCLV